MLFRGAVLFVVTVEVGILLLLFLFFATKEKKYISLLTFFVYSKKVSGKFIFQTNKLENLFSYKSKVNENFIFKI